ncbi:MAG: hypothetical protein ACO3BD_03020 [Chitinophagaceae bacterium]
MKRIIWLLFVPWWLASCKQAVTKKITDESLTLPELITLAPVLPLPAIVHDTTLRRKEADSAKLNTVNLLSYLPDTVTASLFPSPKQLRFYVLGAIEDAEQGHYLLLKTVKAKKSAAYLFYFNRKHEYVASKQIGGGNVEAGTTRYCKIDGRYNITMVEEKKRNGALRIRETIYYLDANGKFILVMTNSNEDMSAEIRGNPIDTFPRKNKYAGDYATNDKNLVSIRDGNKEKTFHFFIHFSKQNDACIGELKGEATWIDKQRGVFRDPDAACVIYFTFSNRSVGIQEENGCGAYRDITCFFEGTYPRKRDMVKKKKTTR